MSERILLVDDEPMVGKALQRLMDEFGYECATTTSPIDALQLFDDQEFQLVIADQRMPMLLGHELLFQIRQKSPTTRTILMSAYSDFHDVVSAFNSGSIDQFVPKPWDEDALIAMVMQLMQLDSAAPPAGAAQPKATPRSSALDGLEDFRGIRSSSPAMFEVFRKLKKAAVVNLPVFICGETGTGKEMSARSVHLESTRAQEPFISFNCANFSDTLMESQLFGHRKGAFTGAVSDQPGLLNEVGAGTLFLDEVTSMDVGLQAKLLRVLQEREFSVVGSYRMQPFKGQVVSASSVALEDAVAQGSFREDLRYRLEVIRISLPPLRERPEDILALFNHFLHQGANGNPPKLSSGVKQKLLAYRWPGNVRQLQNAAMYSAAMCETNEVQNEDLPRDLRLFDVAELRDGKSATNPMKAAPLQASRSDTANEITIEPAASSAEQPPAASLAPTGKPVDVSQEELAAALQRCDGNKSHAARELGISRMTLWRLMKKFELE